MGILSAIAFIPTIGGILLLLIPKNHNTALKFFAVFSSFVSLLLSTYVLFQFEYSRAGVLSEADMQFVEHLHWIPMFNIDYFIGVDGLSMPLVFLTTLLCFIGVIASWEISKAVKGYMSLFLFLETGLLGTLMALDFFLFFIFWNIVLLPVYFLIGFWGGSGRERAATNFFLYNLIGSACMLIGMLALYFSGEPNTFNFFTLISNNNYSFDFQIWIFLSIFLAVAVRIPIFPFHTWLPSAIVELPIAVSVVVAGVMIKLGIYLLIRVCYPILPAASHYFAIPIAVSGVIMLIYCCFVAMAQTDLRKMAAYVSMSFMGFILLGVSVFTMAAFSGSLMHLFNHGIIAAMLLLVVGRLEDGAQSREIGSFGGLGLKVPIFAAISWFAAFAALGLPVMSSFISQVLVLMGVFERYPLMAVIAIIGILITTGYLLSTFRKVFLGPLHPGLEDFREMTKRELVTIVPLGIIVILLGIYPTIFLRLVNSSFAALSAFIR